MNNIKILLAFGVIWVFAGASGFAADDEASNVKSSTAQVSSKKLNLDGNEVDLSRLEKEGGYKLQQITRKRKMRNGKEAEVKVDRRAKYFLNSKRVTIVESTILDDAAQGVLKVYDLSGKKVFEKRLELEDGVYRDFQDLKVVGERYVAAFIGNAFTDKTKRLDIYDSVGGGVVFSKALPLSSRIFVPPFNNYVLLVTKSAQGKLVEIYKHDFKELKRIADGEGLFFEAFSNDGRSYVIGKTKKLDTGTSAFPKYSYIYSFFTDDSLKASAETGEFEYPKKTQYSIHDQYIIFSAETDAVRSGDKITAISNVAYVFDSGTGKVLAQGKLKQDVIEKYMNETIGGGR